MSDREYKFKDALRFDRSFRTLADTIQNEPIKEIVRYYVNNMDRVVSMGSIPLQLGGIVQHIDNVRDNMIGIFKTQADKAYPPEIEYIETDYTGYSEAEARSYKESDERRHQDNIKFRQYQIDQLDQAKKILRDRQDEIDRRGVSQTYGLDAPDGTMHQILNLDEDDKEEFKRGLEATLSSMVVGAWTAYEALATDLWVRSVNERPMSLGVNALLARPKNDELNPKLEGETEDEEATENDETEKQTKKIREKFTPMNLDILKKYKFNLGSSLGTMIYSELKFSFNSLDGISYAYFNTFCVRQKKNKGKFGTVSEAKQWFSGQIHDKLRILAALRHVFVHRGGMADKLFLERVGSHPSFSRLLNGDMVLLDGEIVREYVDASISRAAVLAKGVDAWLMKPE